MPGQHLKGHATPVRGGNLVIDIETPQQNFDVNQTSDNESIWTYDQIAQTLYINAPDGKTLKPCLATSYSISANKLRWTFQLRRGVRFSTGMPMTSRDVAFSIDQALNPNSVWAFVDSSIKSVTASGPYAVVIVTKHPWAPLLADLALFANAVVPYNFGGKTRAEFFQHPTGTGPFELSQWVKGQSLTLTRNPYYWVTGQPYLNSVTYVPVSNSSTRMIQLEGGKADVIEGAPFLALQLHQGSRISARRLPLDPHRLRHDERAPEAIGQRGRPSCNQLCGRHSGYHESGFFRLRDARKFTANAKRQFLLA